MEREAGRGQVEYSRMRYERGTLEQPHPKRERRREREIKSNGSEQRMRARETLGDVESSD